MIEYIKDETLGNLSHRLEQDFYNANYTQLKYLYDGILSKLSKYKYFAGVEFEDIGGRDIRVHICHKKIMANILYSYILYYDFSNVESILRRIEKDWKEHDNMQKVEEHNKYLTHFIKECNKWGYE